MYNLENTSVDFRVRYTRVSDVMLIQYKMKREILDSFYEIQTGDFY